MYIITNFVVMATKFVVMATKFVVMATKFVVMATKFVVMATNYQSKILYCVMSFLTSINYGCYSSISSTGTLFFDPRTHGKLIGYINLP